MIPILYENNERVFASNGLGRLTDCVSCTVTADRNGIYECKFEYPISGEMYSQIQEGRIIGVIHDDHKDIQPFDIYARSAPLDGIVTFYAHHVSYRLGNIVLKPMSASSCAATLSAIPNNTYTTCPFTFWTDKSTSGTWSTNIPVIVKEMLGGTTGSILDVYGKGDYQWDKWTVRLYAERGNDNGVSIRYGVNLTYLKQDYDTTGMYNGIIPFWRSVDGNDVVILDKIIFANGAQDGRYPWVDDYNDFMEDGEGNTIEFATFAQTLTIPLDLSKYFNEEPTQAQLEAEAVRQLNNSEAWLPSENITVRFVDLAHTEEYKDVAALQRVSLCDRVSVYCGPLGVNAVSMMVIRVVYNVLTERYDEIELGKAKTSFVKSVMKDLSALAQQASETPTKSMLKEAIDNATSLITGAQNSHVKFVYDANGGLQEILVMDTEDINTAVNVWRWNTGGLGFSSNGYAGPYTLAMTQDGSIVASMIKTGEMSANHIKGGTLTLGGENNTSGVLEVKDASGTTRVSADNNGIFAYKGYIGDFYIEDGSLKYGSSGIGASITKDGISYAIKVGQNIIKTEIFAQGVKFYWNSILKTMLYIVGNGLTVRCYDNNGDSTFPLDIYLEDDTHASKSITLRYPVRCLDAMRVDGEQIVVGNASFSRNLTVNGTKSRVVSTDQYSDRLLYCYETPSPMFGDIGEGVIGDDGKCYIWLDPVFAQTISAVQYQVFLQKYGDGECWVSKRNCSYFVVEGTPGTTFGWEIKAKQRDYDQQRLERNDELFVPETHDYGADASQHIIDMKKARYAL